MKEPELSNVNVTAFSSSAGQLVQGTSAVPLRKLPAGGC